MAKLVLSSGGSIVYQCFLDKARVNIGRAPHNQVVIDDPAVGEEHAVIIPVGNDHILQNLQSVNGTLVNGSRVVRQILQHGDVMQFGAFYAALSESKNVCGQRLGAHDAYHRAAASVSILRSSNPARPPKWSACRLRAWQALVFRKAAVKVIAGSGAGDTIPLDRVVATFGNPGKQLAVVTRRPHGYFITHVEGRRYPRVNRRSIGKEARVLHHGDVIEVADEKLEFLLD